MGLPLTDIPLARDSAVGWTATTLGVIAEFVMGQAPPGETCNHDAVGTPFVKAGEFGALRPMIREWTTRPLKMAEAGDVLICVVGATSGKLNLGADCAIGRSVAAIRPSGAIDNKFIYYQLLQHVLTLRSISAGSAQGVLSKEVLSNLEFLVAPLNEQQRIVAKIDELFSELDAGVASLKRAKALLKKYRQAVLKAAVTGQLTRDSRERHKGEIRESGAELLQRILKARRGAWETAELKKLRVKGKPPKDDRWKRKYKEPQPPDTTGLPKLPDGWVWVSIGQVFDVFIGSTPPRGERAYWGGDVPWVSSGEVAFCRIKQTRETITQAGLHNTRLAFIREVPSYLVLSEKAKQGARPPYSISRHPITKTPQPSEYRTPTYHQSIYIIT
jgi:hypothetical protein